MPFKLIYNSQNDPKWSSDKLGFGTGEKETLGFVGCALTSVSMMLSGHGYPETPKTSTKNSRASRVSRAQPSSGMQSASFTRRCGSLPSSSATIPLRPLRRSTRRSRQASPPSCVWIAPPRPAFSRTMSCCMRAKEMTISCWTPGPTRRM